MLPNEGNLRMIGSNPRAPFAAALAPSGRRRHRRGRQLHNEKVQSSAETVPGEVDAAESSSLGEGFDFDWLEQWYPVMWAEDLEEGRPTKVRDGDHRRIPLL